MIKRGIILFGMTMLMGGIFAAAAAAQSTVNVRFRAGTSSATYNGTVRGDGYVDYALSASGGQTMSVTLTRTSGADVYFNVLRKGSEVAIADDAREVTSWSGTLDSTDTYVVRVYMPKSSRLAKRTAGFRVKIGVTGSAASSAGGKTVYYDCDGAKLQADFKNGTPPTVRLRFGTQDIELPREESASGEKYEFNNQLFWVKGRNATLESKVLNADCRQTN